MSFYIKKTPFLELLETPAQILTKRSSLHNLIILLKRDEPEFTVADWSQGLLTVPSQLKYLLEVVAFSEDGHSVGNTVEARSPPWECVRSLLCPVPETLFDKCTFSDICYFNMRRIPWCREGETAASCDSQISKTVHAEKKPSLADISTHQNWLMVKIPRFFLSPIPGVGIRHASSAPLNIARNNSSSNLQLPLTVHSHGGTPWRNHATWYFLTFPVLVHHLQDSCWLQPTGPTQWIYCRHW